MTLDRFTLRPEHVALLRAAYVSWGYDEYGAPAIDPKRPYGNSHVVRDIHEILHPDEPWDDDHGLPAGLSPDEWAARVEEYERLHRETETALQVVLRVGFEPGEYVSERYFSAWRVPTVVERNAPRYS